MNSLGIPDFPQDNKYWRIEWIDSPVTYPDDEVRVKIYLAQLVDDFEKPLNNSSLSFKDNKPIGKEILIKVGFLPFFKIGSIWKNGSQEPELPSYFNSFRFTFSLKDTEELILTRYGHYGRKSPHGESIYEEVLTSRDYRIAGEDVLKGKSVVVIRNCNGFSEVIIPSIVIFQSCFISSFKSASKILFGQIKKMIDPHQSGMLAEYPGVFKACLFKDYKDEEAIILSNLYINDIVRKELKKLRNNLKLQKNSLSESMTSIKVSFPFDNIEMFAEGKILPNKNTNKSDRRFFVTRLNILKADLPFNKVNIERKNDGRKGKVQEDDLKPAFPVNKPKGDGQVPLDGYQMVDDDVSLFLDQAQLIFPIGVNIQGVEIVKDKKEKQEYQSATIIKEDPNTSDLISTGDGRSIETNTRGITEKVQPPPSSLTDFLQLLSFLRDSGFNLQSIPISSSHHTHNGWIINEFFYIHSVYSWHKTQDESRYRYFVVAELYYKGTYNYLIDLEPKGTNALSIVLFRSKNGTAIKTEQLVLFMRDTAKNNTWPLNSDEHTYQDEWVIATMRHNRKGYDESIAETILNKLGYQ